MGGWRRNNILEVTDGIIKRRKPNFGEELSGVIFQRVLRARLRYLDVY